MSTKTDYADAQTELLTRIDREDLEFEVAGLIGRLDPTEPVVDHPRFDHDERHLILDCQEIIQLGNEDNQAEEAATEWFDELRDDSSRFEEVVFLVSRLDVDLVVSFSSGQKRPAYDQTKRSLINQCKHVVLLYKAMQANANDDS